MCAAQFRIPFQNRIVIFPGNRLDRENEGTDAITQTFVNGFPQFGKTFFAVGCNIRRETGATQIFELHRKPQSVDTFPGQSAEICIGIIIHIIDQFVAVHRRTFNRAEETAGNPVFEPCFSMDILRRQKGTIRGKKQILQGIDPSSDAFPVSGGNEALCFCD